MSGPVFVALVNPKSGGNVGASLLSRFKEILDEERVYNLSEDGGPKRALVEHCQTENLRIIGRLKITIRILGFLSHKNRFRNIYTYIICTFFD